MIKQKKIRGVILSGGQSRRFGSDKSRAHLSDGSTVLASLVKLLSSLHLDPVVIVDRSGKYDDLDLAAGELCDVVTNQGPLGGFLTTYQGLEDEAFLILSCDMPCLTSKILLGLLDHNKTAVDAVVYTDGGRLYPFPALYTRQALSQCAARLEKKDFSVTRLIESFSCVKKIFIEKGDQALFNMNTPQDFENLYKRKDLICLCPDPQNSFLFS